MILMLVSQVLALNCEDWTRRIDIQDSREPLAAEAHRHVLWLPEGALVPRTSAHVRGISAADCDPEGCVAKGGWDGDAPYLLTRSTEGLQIVRSASGPELVATWPQPLGVVVPLSAMPESPGVLLAHWPGDGTAEVLRVGPPDTSGIRRLRRDQALTPLLKEGLLGVEDGESLHWVWRWDRHLLVSVQRDGSTRHVRVVDGAGRLLLEQELVPLEPDPQMPKPARWLPHPISDASLVTPEGRLLVVGRELRGGAVHGSLGQAWVVDLAACATDQAPPVSARGTVWIPGGPNGNAVEDHPALAVHVPHPWLGQRDRESGRLLLFERGAHLTSTLTVRWTDPFGVRGELTRSVRVIAVQQLLLLLGSLSVLGLVGGLVGQAGGLKFALRGVRYQGAIQQGRAFSPRRLVRAEALFGRLETLLLACGCLARGEHVLLLDHSRAGKTALAQAAASRLELLGGLMTAYAGAVVTHRAAPAFLPPWIRQVFSETRTFVFHLRWRHLDTRARVWSELSRGMWRAARRYSRSDWLTPQVDQGVRLILAEPRTDDQAFVLSCLEQVRGMRLRVVLVIPEVGSLLPGLGAPALRVLQRLDQAGVSFLMEGKSLFGVTSEFSRAASQLAERLPVGRLRRLELPTLTPKDAHDMVHTLGRLASSHTPDETLERLIVQACGGHPFLIHWVGAELLETQSQEHQVLRGQSVQDRVTESRDRAVRLLLKEGWPPQSLPGDLAAPGQPAGPQLRAPPVFDPRRSWIRTSDVVPGLLAEGWSSQGAHWVRSLPGAGLSGLFRELGVCLHAANLNHPRHQDRIQAALKRAVFDSIEGAPRTYDDWLDRCGSRAHLPVHLDLGALARVPRDQEEVADDLFLNCVREAFRQTLQGGTSPLALPAPSDGDSGPGLLQHMLEQAARHPRWRVWILVDGLNHVVDPTEPPDAPAWLRSLFKTLSPEVDWGDGGGKSKVVVGLSRARRDWLVSALDANESSFWTRAVERHNRLHHPLADPGTLHGLGMPSPLVELVGGVPGLWAALRPTSWWRMPGFDVRDTASVIQAGAELGLLQRAHFLLHTWQEESAWARRDTDRDSYGLRGRGALIRALEERSRG